MDRSAIGSIETRGAERRLVRQRQIDQRLTNPGHVAAVRRFRRAARPAFERIGIGAVGDELDDAAERACAIERPLRAAQHLDPRDVERSEEHTSELQSLMRISYAVFCLKTKKTMDSTQAPSTTRPTTKTKH